MDVEQLHRLSRRVRDSIPRLMAAWLFIEGQDLYIIQPHESIPPNHFLHAAQSIQQLNETLAQAGTSPRWMRFVFDEATGYFFTPRPGLSFFFMSEDQQVSPQLIETLEQKISQIAAVS